MLGRFGTYELADSDARIHWIRTVRREAERLGMAWCYRDFATDFGDFDPTNHTWRTPLRDALLNDSRALHS